MSNGKPPVIFEMYAGFPPLLVEQLRGSVIFEGCIVKLGLFYESEWDIPAQQEFRGESVARFCLERKLGRKLLPHERTKRTCTYTRCVNLDHLAVVGINRRTT